METRRVTGAARLGKRALVDGDEGKREREREGGGGVVVASVTY